MTVIIIGTIVVFLLLIVVLLAALRGVSDVSEWEKAQEDEDQLRALREYNRKRTEKRERKRARIDKITSRFRR